MPSIAQTVFLDSEFGVETELLGPGTSLEHPLVFDSVAREFHTMAKRGTVEILSEHVSQYQGDSLIDRLTFRRLQ